MTNMNLDSVVEPDFKDYSPVIAELLAAIPPVWSAYRQRMPAGKDIYPGEMRRPREFEVSGPEFVEMFGDLMPAAERSGWLVAPMEPEPFKINDAVIHGDLDPSLLDREVEMALSPHGSRTLTGRWKVWQGVVRDWLTILSEHKVGEKDGPCFLQGPVIAGDRKAQSVPFLDWMLLDLDTGESIDAIKKKLAEHDLFATIYTTHSHLKTVTEVRKDAIVKACGKPEPAAEDVVRFLIQQKRYQPEVLEGATIAKVEHTAKGIEIFLAHRPMPKFRVMMLLKERFVIADRPGTQKEAIDEWRERMAGTSRLLGAHFDRSTTDPSRLFYTPRHPKGATEYSIEVIAGKSLDLDSVPRVTAAELRDEAMDPMARVAREMNAHSAGTYATPGLKDFAFHYGKRFEICDFINEMAPETERGAMTSGSGTVFRCPNDDAHTNSGDDEDKGFFAINASESDTTGGFAAKCLHDACSQIDRLGMLDRLCQEHGIGDAEGLRKWCFKEGNEADDDDSILSSVNKRFFLVNVGKEEIVGEDAKLPGRQPKLRSTHGFATKLANLKIAVVGGDKKMKLLPASKLWLEWPERRDFDRLVFEPSGSRKNVASTEFNTWNGFPVKGKQGDWSLLRNHIRDNVCHANPAWFAWWMTWAADIFQNPADLKGSAIVHHGEERGSGKTMPFEFLREALGGEDALACKVSSKKFLTGDFNALHAGKLFLQAEEVTWGGSKEEAGKLKDKVTSDTTIIEKKGVDGIPMSSYMRIGITSNERWVVPTASSGERRWFVLHVLPTLKGNKAMFDAILHQMRTGGGIEAMVYELEHWTPNDHGLEWGDLRQPPVTEALLRQAAEGRDPSERFFLELIEAGSISARTDRVVKAHGENTEDLFELPVFGGVIPTEDLRPFHNAWIKANGGANALRDYGKKDCFLDNGVKFFGCKVQPRRHGDGGKKTRSFKVPALADLKAALAAQGLIRAETSDGGDDEQATALQQHEAKVTALRADIAKLEGELSRGEFSVEDALEAQKRDLVVLKAEGYDLLTGAT